MTLLEIEAFLAVVKYGNISTAAQKLFVTQPSLTRRIQLMERELGFLLFHRQKGNRTSQLTEKGAEFYRIAWKWKRLWAETNALVEKKKSFSIASIGSVHHLLLSKLLPQFIEMGHSVTLYSVFSEDAYRQMAKGLYDIAFIELQNYSDELPSNVRSIPTFIESFSVVTFQPLPNKDGIISLSSLQPEKEIYLLWNKECMEWHGEYFDAKNLPYITIDNVDMAKYFLKDDKWCFAPFTTAANFQKKGAYLYTIKESNPPDQIIYHLVRNDSDMSHVKQLLTLLNDLIDTMPQDKIRMVKY